MCSCGLRPHSLAAAQRWSTVAKKVKTSQQVVKTLKEPKRPIHQESVLSIASRHTMQKIMSPARRFLSLRDAAAEHKEDRSAGFLNDASAEGTGDDGKGNGKGRAGGGGGGKLENLFGAWEARDEFKAEKVQESGSSDAFYREGDDVRVAPHAWPSLKNTTPSAASHRRSLGESY